MADPAPSIPNTQGPAIQGVNDSIAAQQKLLEESIKANTAMAWLQMAISIAGKISGR